MIAKEALFNCCPSLPAVLMSPVVSYNGEVVEEVVELTFEDFGEMVQLECSVAAHPTPSISWSRNDSSPLTGTQTFTGFR